MVWISYRWSITCFINWRLLTTLYDQNVIQNNSSESIAGILENHTLNLLLDLFNLPRNYYLGKILHQMFWVYYVEDNG